MKGVLGEAWVEMINVLQIFCIAGVMTSIVTVTGALYISQGAASLQLRVNLLTKPISVVGLLIGMQWGLIGVATAFAITTTINSIVSLTFAGRLINLRLATLVTSLFPTLASAILMAVIVWLVRPMSGLANELVLLVAQIVLGASSYALIVFGMRIGATRDVIELVRGHFDKKKET